MVVNTLPGTANEKSPTTPVWDKFRWTSTFFPIGAAVNGLKAIKSQRTAVLGRISRKALALSGEMESLVARIDIAVEAGTDPVISGLGEIQGAMQIDALCGQYAALCTALKYLKEGDEDE